MKAKYRGNEKEYLAYYDGVEVCAESSEAHPKSAIQVRNQSMIVLVGRYCVGFRVTIWNGDSNSNVAVSHQVLKRLRIHPRLSLIAAVGVSAYMRSD